MNCNFCHGSGTTPGSHPVCTCPNCSGTGRYGTESPDSSYRFTPLGLPVGPEPTTPEEIRKARRGTFIFWFIASMVISVMLGPAGFFIWLMIVTMIGAVNLIHWLLSLGSKKDKPKLD